MLQTKNMVTIFHEGAQRFADHANGQRDRKPERIAVGPVHLLDPTTDQVGQVLAKVFLEQRNRKHLGADVAQDLLLAAGLAQAFLLELHLVGLVAPAFDPNVYDPH